MINRFGLAVFAAAIASVGVLATMTVWADESEIVSSGDVPGVGPFVGLYDYSSLRVQPLDPQERFFDGYVHGATQDGFLVVQPGESLGVQPAHKLLVSIWGLDAAPGALHSFAMGRWVRCFPIYHNDDHVGGECQIMNHPAAQSYEECSFQQMISCFQTIYIRQSMVAHGAGQDRCGPREIANLSRYQIVGEHHEERLQICAELRRN